MARKRKPIRERAGPPIVTLRKIAAIGHPVLYGRAEAVGDPSSREIQDLIDDMIETLLDARGVGLAAPQVYAPLRILVALNVDDERTRRSDEPLILVDPWLEPDDGAPVLGVEGCLSIPYYRALVPRSASVRWRARDREGRPIMGEAHGLLARILQHEVDHLDGVLYTMRLCDPRHLAFQSEADHLALWLPGKGEEPAQSEER